MLFVKEVGRIHGLPSYMDLAVIFVEEEVRFTSSFWKELHKLQGKKLHMSSTYHPQSNGPTGVVNKRCGELLATLCL